MPSIRIKINGTLSSLSEKSIKEAVFKEAAYLLPSRKWQVEIELVHDQEMKKINFSHRQEDYPTDVLSFPAFAFQKGLAPKLPPGPLMLGTIILNLDAASRQANQSGHTLPQEVQFLIAHGVRHLLGFHHGQ